ncbi:DinB family protein [Sporosarcina thermotolerans]|uniref:DinB family protein n=1 Tax=Sporosarcina thermotolerans TaxID=633404 RepID=A0AAW9A9C5_9BACL|nr:DinB family protein [Sporosarcina thermotolerans]MDW0117659.1 DinB family protein [Sporosarcina thermotolerans]WHT49247.1 DinB family protein [Sporosarcina thermotolerans]
MYRKVEDYVEDWNASANGTLNVIKAITNDKLDQAIVEGHSTLGWLAWHLVGSVGFFGGLSGLKIEVPAHTEPVPTDVTEIVAAYEKVMASMENEIANLTDDSLTERVPAFGTEISRGKLLRTFIDHQTHHRGQMTVLLRQAGLAVPGVMGPTKEMQ